MKFQRLIFLTLVATHCLPLFARPHLPWSQVDQKLTEIWDKRYPVPLKKFDSNPDKKGILRVIHNSRFVYYYQYNVYIHKPARKNENELKADPYFRKIELWVRYRPELSDPFDLSFARVDLLPGKNKRWIR